MKKPFLLSLAGAMLTLGFVSCSDDDDIINNENSEGYNPGKIEMR